jgi:hypothetical protein
LFAIRRASSSSGVDLDVRFSKQPTPCRERTFAALTVLLATSVTTWAGSFATADPSRRLILPDHPPDNHSHQSMVALQQQEGWLLPPPNESHTAAVSIQVGAGAVTVPNASAEGVPPPDIGTLLVGEGAGPSGGSGVGRAVVTCSAPGCFNQCQGGRSLGKHWEREHLATLGPLADYGPR